MIYTLFLKYLSWKSEMLYRNYPSFMKTQNNFGKIQSNTFKYTCVVEHINELLFEVWSLPGLSFLSLHVMREYNYGRDWHGLCIFHGF